MKKNSLLIFFLLTFVLAWGLWVPATLTKLSGGTSVLGPDGVGQFGRWAPGIAAILLIGFVAGKQGLGALFSPLKIWRVGIGWYMFALLFQPVLFFIAKWIDAFFGNTYEIFYPLSTVDAPIAFVIPVVIITAIPGAFMEELGWRGFALPKLQNKNNALIASIILGLIWGLWHIPSMIYLGEKNVMNITLAVVNTIPVTILFTWLFNNTKGSLLLVTLFHASQQYSENFLGSIPSGTSDIIIWLVAIIVLIVTGVNNLSKSTSASKVSEQKLVRDLMTVGVPTCKWETPIQDIARFLLEHHIEAMCVLDVKEIESSDKLRVRLSSHKKGDYHN